MIIISKQLKENKKKNKKRKKKDFLHYYIIFNYYTNLFILKLKDSKHPSSYNITNHKNKKITYNNYYVISLRIKIKIF